jgi:hypothetical protein
VRIAAAGGCLIGIGTNVSVVVCAPLDCREALLAGAPAETRVVLPGAAVEQDAAARAGPGELGAAAAQDEAVRAGPEELGVAAVLDGAVRAGPEVQDGAAEPGVLAVVRVATRVPVGAGAQDVLAAVPAGSRLAPPAWWAVYA